MKFLSNKKNILIIISFLLVLYIQYTFKIKCPWINDFGIYCAGCGGTRMVTAIFNLEFYQALRYNPLLFITLIIMFLYVIYITVCCIIKTKARRITTNYLVIYLIITIIFMILRNLDCFSYLRPTVIK